MPALAAWGVPVADIHYEAFGPASVGCQVRPKAGGSLRRAVEVRFRRSGRTLTWDGQDASLLDFAERHGIEVESGCRSGGCGSCETRLLAGTCSTSTRPTTTWRRATACSASAGRTSALVLEA